MSQGTGQRRSPEPRLAAAGAGALGVRCSGGDATERQLCKRAWPRHEWEKPASPRGVTDVQREPESFREIASDESQVVFPRPYPHRQLPLQHPSASAFPALRSYSCAQAKSTAGAAREGTAVAMCSFFRSWDQRRL